jgi:aryl-alcohol dehydrogenase-like predicted oxidoreductase
MGAPNIHSTANIRGGVEHSLRSMRADCLDLVQFHQSLNRETRGSEERWMNS